jgi:Domain of unknown function DUF11
VFGVDRGAAGRAAMAVAAVAGTLLATGAPPASAQAPSTLTVTQQVSSRLVEPGSPVTITITVANPGPGTVDAVHVDTIPRRPEALDGTGDTYTSVTSTQGTCTIGPGFNPLTPNGPFTTVLSCDLGSLAPGASVVITSVVTMTLPADFFVLANQAQTNDIVNVDAPPVVTGSRRAKIAGIPKGCAPGDIPLTVTAPKTLQTKSIETYASLPESTNVDAEPVTWKATASGSRLKTKVPASKIALGLTDTSGDRTKFDQAYKLHVIVHRHHAGALKTTILFKTCAQPLHGVDLG